MADIIENIYIKETELMALLDAVGVSRWYGPDITGERSPDEESDLNRLLAGLYRRSAVDWDDGSAVITGLADAAVRIISRASVCIITGKRSGGADLTYVYPADGQVVCLSVSENEKETFRIAVMPFEEWITQLEDAGYFPEQTGTAPDGPKLLSSEAESVMELHDMATGGILRQIHIVDNGGYGVICVTGLTGQELMLCGRDEYVKVLKQWTEVNAQ